MSKLLIIHVSSTSFCIVAPLNATPRVQGNPFIGLYYYLCTMAWKLKLLIRMTLGGYNLKKHMYLRILKNHTTNHPPPTTYHLPPTTHHPSPTCSPAHPTTH